MKRTMINKLNQCINEEVLVKGWVHRIRTLSKISFVIIRDRSGIVQCVVENQTAGVKGLKHESVVEIKGKIVGNESVAAGFEMHVSELNVISLVTEELPIEVNKEELNINLETLLNNRVLSLRNLKNNAIFKIQAAIVQGFTNYLAKESFTQIFTPKIVSEGAEGGTELFQLDYFSKKAYLAQSPQFYKQMMVGAGYEKVFEVGHVYRAESHSTKRHINEYVSLDLEMGFIENELELMELETALLKHIFSHINETCSAELEILEVELPEIGESIVQMELTEAINILKEHYNKIELEEDLDPEGEKLISEYVKEKYGSEFVFLTHYPQHKRPMYTMPAENGKTRSFDLLFRGLEITTGGLRIHQYNELKESIANRGMNPEKFTTYLEAFKYGMPPHGGLAIGLERITAMLLGYENIRETTAFPRDKVRLNP